MTLPKISVITPSYNQEDFIEQTIRSVLDQNYENLEYIIVDGNSSDNTLKILDKYKENLLFISEPDQGQTDAINKGFKMATGDIYSWINSDDLYNEGAFHYISSYLIDNPQVEMIYGDCENIDGYGRHISYYKSESFNYQRYLNQADIIPQQSVFFRKSVVEKVGYLDTSLNYAMDLEYFLRVSNHCNVAYTPKLIGRFRRYTGTKSKSGNIKVIRAYHSEIEKVIKGYGAKNLNRRIVRHRVNLIKAMLIELLFPIETRRRRITKNIARQLKII